MLNIRISQTQFDQLSETEKAHYVKKDDKYILDVNGDTEEMVRLRQENVTLHQKVLSETSNRNAAEAKVANAEKDAEAKYKTQLDAATAQVAKMQQDTINARTKTLVDGIAAKFNQPELFANTIKNQVNVSYNDKGELVEKFVDAEGKEITLQALTDSYCNNPQYSAMLAKPSSTPTLPTNQQQPAGNTQQPQSLYSPNFSAPVGGNGGQQANWGMENGKPVIYNYAAMTDAETSAYAAAKLAASATT